MGEILTSQGWSGDWAPEDRDPETEVPESNSGYDVVEKQERGEEERNA